MAKDKQYRKHDDEGDVDRLIFGDDIVPDDVVQDEQRAINDEGLVSGVSYNEDNDPVVISAIHHTLDSAEEKIASSPDLSGDDIDADWSDSTGQENVGGSSPTPDQDQVEEQGEPWGITYRNTEELDIKGKIRQQEKARTSDEDEISQRNQEG